ncbi:tyrosine-type recombinase/integrase [uncultured Gemella sp.]|uniref:tyrosine-type recombinase/integrase n=1 Tax=uncultured Gemella sp. TaxID=254352 RepID=UPI0028D26B48|nr:tyrosine-type recombinase/integrase [uncultured Gemella sp.]
MIKEYINSKDNKKYYEVKNEYLGKNVYTGKEKRISKKGFRTKREAQNYIVKAKNEFLNGSVFLQNENITFGDVYKLWEEQHKTQIKESSDYISKSIIKNRILPTFENLKVSKIKLPYCQNYINELSENYTKKYIQLIKGIIVQILDYAVKMEIIPTNYMKLTRIPKQTVTKEKKFYTRKELLQFLKIVKENYSSDIYIIFHLLAYTGMRVGELRALTWKDIDFKNKTLTINKNMMNVGSKSIISDTKTKTSERIIFLDDTTVKELKEFRKNSNSFNITGRLVNSSKKYYVNYILETILTKFPELGKITPHGFRHTHATLLFEGGSTPKDVQNRLGHKDITTTLNTYTHITEEKNKETTKIFEKIMNL